MHPNTELRQRHHAQTAIACHFGPSERCLEAEFSVFRALRSGVSVTRTILREARSRSQGGAHARQPRGKGFDSHRFRMNELQDPFRTPSGPAKAPEGPERLAGGGARNERKHRNGGAVLFPPRRGGRSGRSPGGGHQADPVRGRTVVPFSRPSGAHFAWLGETRGVPSLRSVPPVTLLPSPRDACAFLLCPISSFQRGGASDQVKCILSSGASRRRPPGRPRLVRDPQAVTTRLRRVGRLGTPPADEREQSSPALQRVADQDRAPGALRTRGSSSHAPPAGATA